MSAQIPPASPGLLESLKALAATLVGIAKTRLDLLSNDLEEEREWLVAMLVAALISLFLLGVGVVLLAMLVVVAFWDSHRLLVLAGLTAMFLAGGALASGFVLHKVRTKPRFFAATRAELAKDRQQLRS